jgi:hypothetical protein
MLLGELQMRLAAIDGRIYCDAIANRWRVRCVSNATGRTTTRWSQSLEQAIQDAITEVEHGSGTDQT